MMLSFVHLSDIHFHKYSGDAYDIDHDLRCEIIRDISYEYRKRISTINGILICGDIAFSGDEQQYNSATTFLNEICNALNLDKSHVFCVPGNHDIDQKITSSQMAVALLQKKLDESKSTTEFDLNLGEILRKPEDATVLCAPISCYNNFAAKFGCSFDQKPTWKQEIAINDTFTLCIFGINSAFISNEHDHKPDHTERKMRISRMQIPERKENTVYLSLCHHPPECWVDPDEMLSKKMDDRIAIQLYGHKHLQTIRKTSHGIVVGSGATHPSRLESDWMPRYNWITIDIEFEKEVPTLIIKVYPRVLDDIESKFIPDGSINGEYLNFSFPLNDPALPESEKISEGDFNHLCDPEVLLVESWERRFLYDFINLPYVVREEILRSFRLHTDEDVGKTHVELLNDLVERAKEKACVEKLMERITLEKERMMR